MSLALVGCRPEQEETDFSQNDLLEQGIEAGSDIELECAIIESLDGCIESDVCQPLFEPGGTTEMDFIACIEYGDSSGEESGEMGEGSEGMAEGATNEEDHEAEYADYSCLGHKLELLCEDDDDGYGGHENDDDSDDDDDQDDDDSDYGDRMSHFSGQRFNFGGLFGGDFGNWLDRIKDKFRNKKDKIRVCHVPPGNPDAAHTICISVQGWENGHKDSHQGAGDESGDYLGACKKQDYDGDDDQE